MQYYFPKNITRNAPYEPYEKIPGDYNTDRLSQPTEDKEIQSQEFQRHSATITDPRNGRGSTANQPDNQPKISSLPSPSSASPIPTQIKSAAVVNAPAANSAPSNFGEWPKRAISILKAQRYKILSALIIGIVAWMILVFGVTLGSSLCHARVKHLVF